MKKRIHIAQTSRPATRTAGRALRHVAALALSALALLPAGCTDKPEITPNGGIDADGYCTVALSLALPQVGIVENKTQDARLAAAPAIGTMGLPPATRAVDEKAVNDLWVIQYSKPDGGTKTLVGTPQYFSGLTAASGTLSLKVKLQPGNDMYVELLANTGNPNLLKNITAYPAAGAHILTSTSNTGAGYPDDASTVLPMKGLSAKTTVAPNMGTPIAVALVYLPAYLHVTLDLTKLPAGASFSPSRAQLRCVPTRTDLFGDGKVTSASVPTDFLNEALSGGTPPPFRWYVSPGTHGTGTATNPWEKTAATAPTGQADLCTYIEIAGTYKADASATATEVTYRLWPGENNTTNYDLVSGTRYDITIAPVGADRADMRVTTHAGGFDLGIANPGGEFENGEDWKPYVLTIDPNGILTFKGKMLFFKFGSVVGFTQEGTWGVDKVLFNPIGADYSTYSDIPCYNATDWANNFKNVSASSYHNGVNIKLGKGDPCKLAGLSVKQTREMTEGAFNTYNSGWRLPTVRDWFNFSGLIYDDDFSTAWTASDMRYDKWYYSTGSAGGYFPKGQEGKQKNYLPAAGMRAMNSYFDMVGDGGFYWTNESYSEEVGYYIEFGSNYVSLNRVENQATYGFGVRCVKDNALAVDLNGILTMNNKMLFFQFGSVVGFTQEGQTWAADKVLFNPVTGSPSYPTYYNIPRYNDTDWANNLKNISAANYHTGANVKAGKGDPCKLVGLSAADIQRMSEAELNVYNSGWRLPTGEENRAFTGQTANNAEYRAHMVFEDTRYDKWYYTTSRYDLTTSTGAYFPMGQENQKKNYLPASSRRAYDQGISHDNDEGGFFWSNEAAERYLAYSLVFGIMNNGVSPSQEMELFNGLGVRCVRNP